MMKLGHKVRLLMTAALMLGTAYGARGQRTSNDQIFEMAEKLEKAQPWSMEKVGAITGAKSFHEGSMTTWESPDNETSVLVRRTTLFVNPLQGGAKRITGVAIEFPKQGAAPRAADVVARYGRATRIESPVDLGVEAEKQLGYRKSVRWAFKRKSDWLTFIFDGDGKRVLRGIEVAARM
jgi:hypothetical protein